MNWSRNTVPAVGARWPRAPGVPPRQLEIQRFVAALAPLLARAMHLRGLQLSAAPFRQQAAKTRAEIEAVTSAPVQHPAIQKIQNLFREKAARLCHWARDRRVPAEDNRAERELRPPVIARQLSFGSQSEAGRTPAKGS